MEPIERPLFSEIFKELGREPLDASRRSSASFAPL
jgi:hypothetical protein